MSSSARCAYCGRGVQECWVMPCILLDDALKRDDQEALARWAKASGVGLRRGEEVLVEPSE